MHVHGNISIHREKDPTTLYGIRNSAIPSENPQREGFDQVGVLLYLASAYTEFFILYFFEHCPPHTSLRYLGHQMRSTLTCPGT